GGIAPEDHGAQVAVRRADQHIIHAVFVEIAGRRNREAGRGFPEAGDLESISTRQMSNVERRRKNSPSEDNIRAAGIEALAAVLLVVARRARYEVVNAIAIDVASARHGG